MAPSLLAMMQIRSHSMDAVKMAGPDPSFPRMVDAGTVQSLSVTSHVGEVRSPILSSYRATRKPGNDGSTRNAVTPFAPAAGSVLAKTT